MFILHPVSTSWLEYCLRGLVWCNWLSEHRQTCESAWWTIELPKIWNPYNGKAMLCLTAFCSKFPKLELHLIYKNPSWGLTPYSYSLQKSWGDLRGCKFFPPTRLTNHIKAFPFHGFRTILSLVLLKSGWASWKSATVNHFWCWCFTTCKPWLYKVQWFAKHSIVSAEFGGKGYFYCMSIYECACDIINLSMFYFSISCYINLYLQCPEYIWPSCTVYVQRPCSMYSYFLPVH